jgi:hypothetical protein
MASPKAWQFFSKQTPNHADRVFLCLQGAAKMYDLLMMFMSMLSAGGSEPVIVILD